MGQEQPCMLLRIVEHVKGEAGVHQDRVGTLAEGGNIYPVSIAKCPGFIKWVDEDWVYHVVEE